MTYIFRRRWKTALRANGWTLFKPILPGATLRDRMIACIGAAVGIGLTGLICGVAVGQGFHLPLLIAPMGASSVLVFAVPASPLAQPWPVIGGNIISALIGVTVGHLVPEPAVAAGLAAGLAIAAMSFTRSLHPPGGATALLAALGGSSVSMWDFWFPLFPVGVNACLLAACGWTFHKLARNSYPHIPVKPVMASVRPLREPSPARRIGFRPQDIDAALERMGEAFDISRDDLDALLREVEHQALIRDHSDLTCADVMSRNVVYIHEHSLPMAARVLLVSQDIRDIPVLDAERRVKGVVGLQQIARPAMRVGDVSVEPVTARPETPALELLGLFTGGQVRTVIVVDDQRHLLGVITQTDLLAATARILAQEARQGVAA